MRHRFFRTLLLPLALTACAGRPPASPPPEPAATAAPAPSAFESAIHRGRVIVAAQPSVDDLASLTARGVVAVISARTADEMDPATLGFDEPALLAERGIAYVHTPIGGAAGFSPATLEAYRAALEANDGTVLVHCASGGRAAQLHAAYEVKYLGRPPDEALRDLATLGAWPLPLERLTGIPLEVRARDEATPAEK